MNRQQQDVRSTSESTPFHGFFPTNAKEQIPVTNPNQDRRYSVSAKIAEALGEDVHGRQIGLVRQSFA